MTESSPAKAFKTEIQHELETYDSLLKKAKDLASVVPTIQEAKEDAQARLFAVNKAPEDLVEELAPMLLKTQRHDFQPFRLLDESIPPIAKGEMTYSSTTGTTSSITEVIVSIYPSPIARPTWANEVIGHFTEVAETKAKRNSLPEAISALSASLGNDFEQAEAATQQAKAGLLQPHQAAASMRNVIQQVWGAFVARSRMQMTDPAHEKRFELRKPSHRSQVSAVLTSASATSELENRLATLFAVYQDLSRLSKKTGTPPLQLLHDLRTRWILALDALRPYFHPPSGGAA